MSNVSGGILVQSIRYVWEQMGDICSREAGIKRFDSGRWKRVVVFDALRDIQTWSIPCV